MRILSPDHSIALRKVLSIMAKTADQQCQRWNMRRSWNRTHKLLHMWESKYMWE